MFDPRSPYHRRMWHYDSDRALSVAQLIALGSLDARTAALLWLLVERHTSLIVSGPTDPTPGIGKTTTLNALLGFLPAGSTLVYTTGMFEDFSFRGQVEPGTTCVLANEVSDHLRIYMWGGVAREFLRLPGEGFAVATSCHADTVEDVLRMLLDDLTLEPSDVRRLGVIVNIGLVGKLWPPRRRFLSVNLVLPQAPDPAPPGAAVPRGRRARRAQVCLVPLATWDETTDGFVPPTPAALEQLAGMLALTSEALDAALARRAARLEHLAAGRGAGPSAQRAAVEALAEEESPSGEEAADETAEEAAE